MNCTRMSRFLLHKLPVKANGGLCPKIISSNSNKHLLYCSYSFLNSMAHRRNYSHLSCGQYNTIATWTFIPISKSVTNNSLFCYSLSSYPLNTTLMRGLRGYPSNRTDKQNLDKTARKTTGILGTEQQNVGTDFRTEVPVSEAGNIESDATQKLTLYQRFKKTYKEHGKVLVAVHLVTSFAWFGSFYTLTRCGFNIVPYLEHWNFSEKVISPFRSGGLGDLALAYLLYKLATPARYTVTIGGTNLVIRYLRREGKIPHVPKEDTIRSLYKEGKEDLQRRSQARIKKLRRKSKNKQSDTLTKDKP